MVGIRYRYMKLLLLTILACLIPLTAFAQEKAEDCQTKSDILMTYGEPFWKSEGGRRDLWYYPHKRMFVYFEGDKAVEIDVVTAEKI